MTEKMLIVGPAWVGDMMMAQSLFKLLKQNDPALIIDVLAPAWSQALLQRMPEVHQTWVAPFKHGELSLKKRYQLAKTLRTQNYQTSIILPNSFKSALIPYWAKIPVRTGWLGEWPRNLLLTDVRRRKSKELPMMIERFMALGLPKNKALPIDMPWPSLQVSKDSLASALKKHNLQPPEKPLLVLAPGAEFGPSKRWPANYFAEVASAKLAQGWDVWLFGSPNDSSIAQEIQTQLKNRCVDLTGKTNLAEAVDLLSLATAVVSNDSGLMHIAAALNLPLVAIYGSTSTLFTPPLSDKVAVLSLHLPCSPCFKRTCPLGHWKCMLDLKPEMILHSLDTLVCLKT